jgi:hypothetical protein
MEQFNYRNPLHKGVSDRLREVRLGRENSLKAKLVREFSLETASALDTSVG